MKADLFLTNGPIYSGVHPKPYNYLAIRNNRVFAIGRGSGKQFVGRKTEVINLKGNAVTPAITDSHLHLLDYAWSLERVNLEPCRSPTEIERALSTVESSGEWVLGRGWTREQFN